MNNKVSVKSLIIGTLIGGLLTSGVGYASSNLSSIDVNVLPISFIINGERLEAEQETFIHEGAAYVPVRWISENLGKRVEWDGKSQTISITSPDKSLPSKEPVDRLPQEPVDKPLAVEHVTTESLDFLNEDVEMPEVVREWALKNYMEAFRGHLSVDGSTYVLIARGESPSSGYGVQADSAYRDGNHLVVEASYLNPDQESFYLTVITYPSVLIKINEEFEDVTIEVDEGIQASLTMEKYEYSIDESIKFNITNQGAETIYFGRPYTIETLVEDEWVKWPMEDIAFTMELIILGENESFEQDIATDLLGLTQGMYRVSKVVFTENNDHKEKLSTTFIIK